MLAEIIFFILLGILFGIFTGLIPGIHINLIGAMIISGSLGFLLNINPIYLVIFTVSMSISHIFLDFIPSIFLGAPEDGTELSVLPGHEMLKKGLGFQAVNLTAKGCLFGIFIFLLLIPPIFFISKITKNIPTIIIVLGLIITSLNMIFLERKRFMAFFVFLLTGTLGYVVLNIELKEPLLPLLTGLFGSSGLFFSIKQKTKIRKQKIQMADIKIKNQKKSLVTSAIFSPLSLFLPALSGGQIAIMCNQFAKTSKKGFLFLLGIITMLTMCLSFLGLFLIGKTRTGSAAVIKNLTPILNWKIFLLILFVIIITGFLSYLIVNLIARKFLYVIEKTDYSKISIFVIILVSIITFFVSGFIGLLVLVISTATGIYCISSGVKRTNMMGCLILPTIVLYLF
ncbi:MAG: tripartite tricarboxylate transporter permease [Candidatus Pacearchaeota archaeon]